jgi:RNA 3'-terminal phosphate cyclase (ATP)
MISVDGSLLEGGGQLIRTAISLSAILHKHIKISHIREKRSVPGLANQHLAGVRLVESISRGSLVGDKIKSTEVEFIPGSSEQELSCKYLADSGTAGAISLLVQVSLPCLLYRQQSCSSQTLPLPSVTVEYKGGTNVNFSPPIGMFSFCMFISFHFSLYFIFFVSL